MTNSNSSSNILDYKVEYNFYFLRPVDLNKRVTKF